MRVSSQPPLSFICRCFQYASGTPVPVSVAPSLRLNRATSIDNVHGSLLTPIKHTYSHSALGKAFAVRTFLAVFKKSTYAHVTPKPGLEQPNTPWLPSCERLNSFQKISSAWITVRYAYALTRLFARNHARMAKQPRGLSLRARDRGHKDLWRGRRRITYQAGRRECTGQEMRTEGVP